MLKRVLKIHYAEIFYSCSCFLSENSLGWILFISTFQFLFHSQIKTHYAKVFYSYFWCLFENYSFRFFLLTFAIFSDHRFAGFPTMIIIIILNNIIILGLNMIYSSVLLYSVSWARKIELDTGILLLPIFFFLLLKLAVNYVHCTVLCTIHHSPCYVFSRSQWQPGAD